MLIKVNFDRTSDQGILHCLLIPCTMNIILSTLGFFITVNSPLRIYYTAENLMNIIFFMLMASSLSPITNSNNTVELLFFKYLLFAFLICVMSMFSQWYTRAYAVIHSAKKQEAVIVTPELKELREKNEKLVMRIEQAEKQQES